MTTPRTIPNRAERIHAAQRARAGYVKPAPLTHEQYEAARLGHPGLTIDEADYYVHCSERYPYDHELWSRDAMPDDYEAQDRYGRLMHAEERRAPGGRIRHAIARREQERRRLPGKRWVARRDAEWADCPF